MYAVCMLMLHTVYPCSLRSDFPSATPENTVVKVKNARVFIKAPGMHACAHTP